MLDPRDHFRIGDRLKRRSDDRICEITGFIQAWPFGYFALRYMDGFNGKVSVGNARKRYQLLTRPKVFELQQASAR